MLFTPGARPASIKAYFFQRNSVHWDKDVSLASATTETPATKLS